MIEKQIHGAQGMNSPQAAQRANSALATHSLSERSLRPSVRVRRRGAARTRRSLPPNDPLPFFQSVLLRARLCWQKEGIDRVGVRQRQGGDLNASSRVAPRSVGGAAVVVLVVVVCRVGIGMVKRWSHVCALYGAQKKKKITRSARTAPTATALMPFWAAEDTDQSLRVP